MKPAFDAVFNVQLADLARVHEDRLLALMLDEFTLDSDRSGDWSAALVQYALTKTPSNRHSLEQWVEKWMHWPIEGWRA